MSENAVADDAIGHDDDDADFDSGFSSKSADDPTATPAVVTEVQAAPAAAAVPEPKYVQVTEEQLTNLMAKAGEFDTEKAETKRKLDSAFGTIGNLKQTIDRLQAGTQAGKPVELTAEDLREISEQYPDLGTSMLKTLQRVAEKMKGTGTAAAPFNESHIDQRVQQQLKPAREQIIVDVRNEIAAEELAETHPDWRAIAGPDGSNTEFRLWLAKQPNGYADKVLNSSRAKLISEALTKFKQTRAPGSTGKQNKRTDVLKAAITPRGDGGHVQGNDDEDEFDKGFKSVKHL